MIAKRLRLFEERLRFRKAKGSCASLPLRIPAWKCSTTVAGTQRVTELRSGAPLRLMAAWAIFKMRHQRHQENKLLRRSQFVLRFVLAEREKFPLSSLGTFPSLRLPQASILTDATRIFLVALATMPGR